MHVKSVPPPADFCAQHTCPVAVQSMAWSASGPEVCTQASLFHGPLASVVELVVMAVVVTVVVVTVVGPPM